MKRLITIALLMAFTSAIYSQTPQGFSYQAIVRDAIGNPVINHAVGIRITLQNQLGVVSFTETHSTTTSPLGVINITIGGGTLVSGSFSSVPWTSGDIYIKIEIDATGGTNYTQVGSPTKLQSVPYAINSGNGISQGGELGQTIRHNGTGWEANSLITNTGTNIGVGTSTPSQTLDVNGNLRLRANLFDNLNSSGSVNQILYRGTNGVVWQNPSFTSGGGIPGQMAIWSGANSLSGISNVSWSSSLQVASMPTAGTDDAIFEVKNKDGKVVFGVYQGGVRVYVEDSPIVKGARGGFAVGGLTDAKGSIEYFRITPDSSRIYVKEVPSAKGARGGFAVGGLTGAKAINKRDLMFIARDSARIFVDTTASTKGARGGFAVGGLTNQGKGSSNNFLSLTKKNYFIGHESGAQNTTGLFNSFIGYQSGTSNTVGTNNVFLGYQTGYTNKEGANNVAIGNLAGYTNNANNNVFIGNESGRYNTTGANNAFMGYFAGRANTTGYSNVFIGKSSGSSNTTGYSNLFIGEESGINTTTGFSNLFLGENSGYSNQTGQHNVFIGRYSGFTGTGLKNNIFIGDSSGYFSNNQFATNNVFIGYAAGKNTQSYNNIFLGNQAGWSNSSGQNNIAIGDKAGFSNTTSQNIFIGTEAGLNNTTGYFNIIMGRWAGRNVTTGYQQIIIGGGAGASLTTGAENIIVGTNAGALNDGNKNIFIGNSAGWSNTGSSNIILGYKVGYSYFQTVSNRLIIDNSQVAAPLIWGEFDNRRVVINGLNTNNINNRTFFVNGSAGGTGAWWNDSDERLKKNICTISLALNKVLQLRGVTFEWKDPNTLEKGTRMGFIAQEAEQIIPEVVSTEGGSYSMQYSPITALLVEAIKEQQNQIIEQHQQIEKQKTEFDALKAELDQIKALLKK